MTKYEQWQEYKIMQAVQARIYKKSVHMANYDPIMVHSRHGLNLISIMFQLARISAARPIAKSPIIQMRLATSQGNTTQEYKQYYG